MDPIQNEANVGGFFSEYGAWIGGGTLMLFFCVCWGLASSGEIQFGSSDEGGVHSERISKSRFGEEWPFTVSSGELRCTDRQITFTAGGTTYAVNGLAESHGAGAPIEPIWRENPDAPVGNIHIGPVIDRGKQLCE